MIEVLRAFTAYPAGKKRVFKPGETVGDLPKADADRYVDAGLAKRVKKGKRDEVE